MKRTISHRRGSTASTELCTPGEVTRCSQAETAAPTAVAGSAPAAIRSTSRLAPRGNAPRAAPNPKATPVQWFTAGRPKSSTMPPKPPPPQRKRFMPPVSSQR